MLNLFRKKDDTGSSFLQPGQATNSNFLSKLFDKNEKEVAKIRPLIEKINTLGPALKEQSDEELKVKSQELRDRFKKLVTERLARAKDAKSGATYEWQELNTEHEWTNEYVTVRRATEAAVLDELLPEAFALTREAGDRTIGLRHFDVQLIGGTVLHTGRIGEMRTGEGKTLVATAPAYLNALSGRGVHVITVNDYLAERDANWMRPIYEFLGLSVSFLTNDMQPEDRQVAYACDILYATNAEVGFDYLRDNMAKQSDEMVQRALNFAIVDEVDNILIDEARTPLIISAQVAKTDRALRRQQMAKTCDGLARGLMPGITDREIDALLDGLTTKSRLDTDTLLDFVLKRGAFTQATNYLIDSYLLAEKSARLENAARLLDVADEFSEASLISSEGRSHLEATALNAVRPEGVRQAWDAELSHLVAPFASAWVEASNSPDVTTRIGTLAWELALSDEVATELASRFNEDASAAPRQQVAEVIADEMVQRGFVSEGARGHVIGQLQDLPTDASVEKASSMLRESVLNERGSLQETDDLIQAALEAGGQGNTPDDARKIIGAIEEISVRGLLPFEPLEHLWEAVRLTQGREGLRKEIASAISKHPGKSADEIGTLVRAYAGERETYLKRESEALRAKLNGHEGVVREASIGHDADALRKALLNDLTKTGAFAQAMKAAKSFWSEQSRAHDQLAAHLAEEMAVYVEVPRDGRKQLAGLFAEGGKAEAVRARILLAVRDLPGENTELPAIVGDATAQLENWRQESAQKLLDAIAATGVQLPIEAQDNLRLAIENGEYSAGWDGFVGEQLLRAPEAAPKAEAIDDFDVAWDEFKEESNGRLLDGIAKSAELSQDAVDAVSDLLDKPLPSQLEGAIFGELASDAVSRHLEPLLTEENAPAFTEEVKRRVPLAKDTQKSLRATEFVGRSSEQLQRGLVRLLERSFAALPFEDFKRVVRNVGWFVEKDEKRRTASLTDMGTLIAEREAGRPVFTDPDGFLDTLQAGEILTDEEAATVRHAEAETPESSLSEVIDRVLRLPAERRRRLSEAKYQEIAPVLDQSIKAHSLFQREVNYVIDTNPENGKREIVIVDDFTGRKMPGRRYSEGLHEALEAKHDLEVQLESQTVATVTIQNYFRLYSKLAGMTGTAKTEEQEFAKTYGMEVVSIPTNRIVRRTDYPDVVFKTNEGKMRAVTFEILEHHCAGQPVLCGTRSVEVSERLSERLKPQALQALVLSHLCKDKIRASKDIPEDQQVQMLEVLRAPLVTPTPEEAHHLRSQNKRVEPASVMQVKSIAKAIGLNPDAADDSNVDALMALFTVPNTSRELLLTALRVGLPHNVLNAKNHRNEARIIAEAARPSSVTIATNMAGRGVDILLGGSLDVESRWRVMTLQTFARHIMGEPIHVRARNQDATDKFLDRLSAEKLQLLGWLISNVQVAEELQKTGALEGQAVKDIREILGAELTTSDIPTKVRSRARRLNVAGKLPLDAEFLDAGPVEAVARELKKLTGRTFDIERIRAGLQSGVGAQTSGRDMLEMAVLEALSLPLGFAWRSTEALVEELPELPDLDRALLEMVVETQSVDATQLAPELGVVSPDWIKQRLEELQVTDASTAQTAIAGLNDDEVEINEAQIATHLGELFMGAQWLRQRLSDWGVVGREARAYEATEELAQMVSDNAIVHYRLIRQSARELQAKWQSGGEARRELTLVEVPNALMLGDLANIVGQNAPFLEPQWLHYTLAGANIINEQEDVAQAQMMGMVQDEEGNVQQQPMDVLVYRIRLERVLARLEPIVRELVAQDVTDPNQMWAQFTEQAPWAEQFVDEGWLAAHAAQDKPRAVAPGTAVVSIETGVAGQSADLVLESEARPEDVAHTSEQDAVRDLGGLHIIGTERHESRRIDNQLRGRAGRQGDPGSSRFYASLEDELWRLFGVRGQFLLNQWDEDEAVEHKLITKSIERAQKKVELNHFESRKHVLQYDDVMNVQREVIYRERRRALLGGDVRDTTLDMAQQAAVSEVEKHCPHEVRSEEWDTHKAYVALARMFGAASLGKHLKQADMEGLKWASVAENMGQVRYDGELSNGESLYGIVEKLYHEREESLGEEHMRNMERYAVTRSIDEHWMEHLAEMDYLRDAIWQESYAQKEPIGRFRQEGFELFQKMLGEIRPEVTETLFGGDAEPDMGAFGGNFPMLNMEEMRMLAEGPFDPDGMDDGVMLNKDADGDDANEPEFEDGFEPAMVTDAYEPSDDEDEVTDSAPQSNSGNANGGNNQRKKNKSKRRH